MNILYQCQFKKLGVTGSLLPVHRLWRVFLRARAALGPSAQQSGAVRAVLAAAGYNFSLLLRWFEELLRVLLLIICRSRSPRLLPG